MEDKNMQEELNEEVEVSEEINESQETEEVLEENEACGNDSKIEELTDSLQRLQAEYANYRRRTQQEKESMGVFANEKILTELIPVVDSMERALDACTDKEDNMYKGIDLVYKQLIDTFGKFGLEEIEAENQEFDPNLHLAVMQEPVEGFEPNHVVTVLQKGYKLNTKILRPSMVKVSC